MLLLIININLISVHLSFFISSIYGFPLDRSVFLIASVTPFKRICSLFSNIGRFLFLETTRTISQCPSFHLISFHSTLLCVLAVFLRQGFCSDDSLLLAIAVLNSLILLLFSRILTSLICDLIFRCSTGESSVGNRNGRCPEAAQSTAAGGSGMCIPWSCTSGVAATSPTEQLSN